jgi:hypothetical protein
LRPHGVQQPPLAGGDDVDLVAPDADSRVVVECVDREIKLRGGSLEPALSPVGKAARVQVRLEVPVEQPDRRTRRRSAEDPQVILLAERLAGPLGQVPAEDHRARADADVDLRLQDVRQLGGESARADAVGQVVVIAALGVDDIGVPQPLENHRPRQPVQLENVQLPPAESVQPA